MAQIMIRSAASKGQPHLFDWMLPGISGIEWFLFPKT